MTIREIINSLEEEKNQLKEEIKRLEEENKNLKEENKKLFGKIPADVVEHSCESPGDHNFTLPEGFNYDEPSTEEMIAYDDATEKTKKPRKRKVEPTEEPINND